MNQAQRNIKRAERTGLDASIVPVLLSGGTGSRLWPLSREARPKQLLSLTDERTLLQQTVARVDDAALFGAPIIIANAEHRFLIAEQLRAIGREATVMLEPVGRSTAPAVAIAALTALRDDPEAIILAMPVDHMIRDPLGFRRAVAAGLPAARAGQFVLFGIRPDSPATGMGYINIGEPSSAVPAVHHVGGFVEKPNLATAKGFLAAGSHLWNSGIFLMSAKAYLEELERLAPDVLTACRAALSGAVEDFDFVRIAADAFAASPSISIDYAVIEKTDKAVVVPVDIGWSDVGSWSALWKLGDKDDEGNVKSGDVVLEDARGCYLRSDGPLVTALGVDDLVVIAASDVVLVTRRDRDQDVNKLVARLRANGHRAATETPAVHRPWGYYQSVHSGERFQVKRITVNPGAKLSLQMHYHRAEHWIVVNGTALVTRDDETVLLRENESIFVPLGCTHRLENPGKMPLNLIEVQSGPYLGEDDIVRIEDVYNRV
ncbi:mannose-1-phosphate guanylyltransferase/mannose-6-phosphate isomerase [Bradyrhizobium sp. LHD-71]|uniref:mannose-1-phosphate guanylyltransferase/mannose-6-phosphate isomerase n=1 Tax=Bradyrhizobium sp. LHD-71 TaxID=3072141 RepID=UPI00280F11AD|nr:mannose-1-phosphate guanylyltransferase/mannose-6-phosphate isomerase [Bradyrhizobium sp. LHD-71]MDQ8729779.1 mannose-1-phosphate guanylyltransferase/mannose-6-phosphate isomerase [Bradyrhizobium sp. LHD-71]